MPHCQPTDHQASSHNDKLSQPLSSRMFRNMMNGVEQNDRVRIKATWRRLSLSDIPALIRIADQVHADLPESDQVFAERVKLFPEGCLGLVSDDDSELLGYAISHPILRAQPPALDSLLGEIAHAADQYYIHDLALLPAVRGGGCSREAVNKMLAIAEQFATTCLISVYETASFWGRFGFVSAKAGVALEKKLVEYGDDAKYMERINSGHEPSKTS